MVSDAISPNAGSVRPRQLALALDHAESYAREDFLSGPCNEDALALVDAGLAGTRHRAGRA
jgi:hypothetical protein